MEIKVVCSRCGYKYGQFIVGGPKPTKVEINPTCDCRPSRDLRLYARTLRDIASEIEIRESFEGEGPRIKSSLRKIAAALAREA
jgi:hypothetical protein